MSKPLAALLTRFLRHPLMGGRDLDDPETTELRRQILDSNAFLRKVYRAWYDALRECLPARPGRVLELGSGAGFLEEHIPGLITSDLLALSGIHVVVDAEHLPFAAGSLGAIVLNNVLHHFRDVRRFFREASRCVRPGGVLAMNEPWVTDWSRFVYGILHHEPFDPRARAWEIPPGGPLSGANSALPWIVFARDRATFEVDFPVWRIRAVRPWMPFQYLASGGFTLRPLMPGWAYAAWDRFESVLRRWAPHLAMFAVIRLERTEWVRAGSDRAGGSG